MGFNHPRTKLTLALLTTFFTIGFCNSISTLINNILLESTVYAFAYLSIANICATFAGGLLAWPLAKLAHVGRRISTLTGLLLLFLGCVLATSTTRYRYAQSVTASVFYGLGVGLVYVTGLIWMVEMAEASRRGRKIVLLYIALSAGTAIGTWVKYGFQYLSTGGLYLRYRIPLGLQLLVLVFPIVLVWRADESWRWTLWRNQPDRARAILSDHMSTPQAAPDLQQAFVALSHHSTQIRASRTLFSKSNMTPSSPRLHPWRRLFLACLVQTMRALSGIVTTQLYLTRAASYLTGFDSSFTLNDAIPTFVFVFSLIPYILIDRPASGIISPFGRRGLLMLSAIGLFAMFLIATIVSATTGSFSLYLWYDGDSSDGTVAGYFVLFLFADLFYMVGFRVVADLFTAEIAAGNTRTETTSIAMSWGVAVDVAISYGASYELLELGWYFFLIFLFLNLVWLVLIVLFYPETQGRSLESLDWTFARGLKVLLGTDREARRGRNIGRGVGEFDKLTVMAEQSNTTAAELSEEPVRSVDRNEMDGNGLAVK